MGCSVSKFNKDEMGHTYLYYNPLHRRFDDLNPWRNKADRATAADPASIKQLLADDDSVTGGGSNDQGRKSSVSACVPSADKATGVPPLMDECIVKLPPTPQQMMKAEGAKGESTSGEVTHGTAEKKNVGGSSDGTGREEVVTPREEEVASLATPKEEEEEEPREKEAQDSGKDRSDEPTNNNNEEENKGEDQDDDNLGLRDREDSIFYPGSPSFREYCFSSDDTSAGANSREHIDVPDNLIEDDDHGESNGIDQMKDSATIKSKKEDNNDSAVIDDPVKKPHEPAGTQPGKKSRRARAKRFLVGLPRTSSGGVELGQSTQIEYKKAPECNDIFFSFPKKALQISVSNPSVFASCLVNESDSSNIIG
ncbi:hypothetical protein CDL15_Pgr005595 [Punica granatum]|uniref:Uncharacterized protein n=1 Tax=Punica granatum TaxID=22663 RepID=A0A218WG10_PUNGR|nr:hypothetical protein CDL15_Pgr005595 [Punica granatum]